MFVIKYFYRFVFASNELTYLENQYNIVSIFVDDRHNE